MNLQCEDGFLFHLWGSTGECVRCGVTGLDLDHRTDHVHFDQGMVAAETSVDDRSELALRELVRLVDHPDLREDDLLPSAPADASAATSHAYLGVRLPAFLRRR